MSTPTPAQPQPLTPATGVRRSLGAAWQITGTELRRYVQDRIALFTLIVLPVMIVFLIGSAFGSAPREFVVGVIDGDGTTASDSLVIALKAGDALQVRDYTDERELRRDIRLSEVSAGVLVPERYAAELAAGHTVAIPVVTVQADQSAAAVVATVAGALAGEGGLLAATSFVATTVEVPADVAEAASRAVAPSVDMPAVDPETVGTVRPEDENAFTRAVFSQLVLFVFMNGVIAAAALVETRRLGIGRRAMAAPVGTTTLVTGVGGSRLALGLLQSVLLLAVGVMFFGVVWGDLGAITALVVLWALVAAGAGMLLGAFARTADQAVAIAVPMGLGLAMLGGTMWSLEFVGPLMRTIGHLTPHAWAMDAWAAIVNESAGVADIATELAVLAGYAAVLLTLSSWALRRTLTR